MMRFNQKDMLRGSMDAPLSLNRYAFVLNNPIAYADPSGLRLVDAEGRPEGPPGPSTGMKTTSSSSSASNVANTVAKTAGMGVAVGVAAAGTAAKSSNSNTTSSSDNQNANWYPPLAMPNNYNISQPTILVPPILTVSPSVYYNTGLKALEALAKASLTITERQVYENAIRELQEAFKNNPNDMQKFSNIASTACEAGEQIRKSGTGVGDASVIRTGGGGTSVGGGGSRSFPYVDNTSIPSANIKDLLHNVQSSFSQYDQSGWKGNVSGQSPGTKAGAIYQNDNGILPTTDAHGNPIAYKEFDVNDKLPNTSRDAERFVVGSDGSVYYSNDHYNTFVKIAK